ncbi:MAG: V-type ATPase subunit [Planctomycetota bacterium]|jgi:V/A-type H+-transporting ATPase subunit C
MTQTAEQKTLDFYLYPPIGKDDFRYAFSTAKVRALWTELLSQAALQDMANAQSFEQAVDLLSTTVYALPSGIKRLNEVEKILLEQRAAVRNLFENLMIDKTIVELFKSRDDFANIRLLLRRTLTEKAIGTDYSSEGNVSPELFEEIFELEKYELLPDYLQHAVEQGILAYYHYKDIRHIDYAIDKAQAKYKLETAWKLNSIFLASLFNVQIDLTNIKTMLRLKFAESEDRDVFLPGGYIEQERLKYGVDSEYDSLGQLFYATPYNKVIEISVNYLSTEKSFIKIEQQTENYISEFLLTTQVITAGPQPVIAYLLEKEKEIRTMRLILTAKKNSLEPKLILDRIGEFK